MPAAGKSQAILRSSEARFKVVAIEVDQLGRIVTISAVLASASVSASMLMPAA